MRWTFHKRRNRRYQIALEELKKTFVDCGGLHIIDTIKNVPRRKLTRRDRKLLRQLDALKLCFAPYSHDYKKRHSCFLKIIRDLLNNFETNGCIEGWHTSFHRLILELCKTKFYRVHLFLFGHHLLQDLFASLIHKREETALNFDTHFEEYTILDESNLIINSQPLIFLERDLRMLTELNPTFGFDPHTYNHPFLLYTLALIRKGRISRLKMVRMGSPTKESFGRFPQVIEEFKGFLTKLKAENKNHLYVNKQRTWGSEGQRSHVIENLETKFDNFFCLCLPADGAFYYQQMSYAKLENAEEFKQMFYNLLVGNLCKGYYHIPKVWLEDEHFQMGIKNQLENVHDVYFKKKEKLSVMERRFFIDHFYTQFILLCLQMYEINSINITCRDGIDRAGCEQAKLLYYMQMSLGIENDLESKIERQFLLHIPPYLAKNRSIVKERIEYLHDLMNQTYNEEVRQKIYSQHEERPFLYHKPHFVKRS